MVAINIMLIGAVLFATGFATQQSVQDQLEGECTLGVAATMLTFERRVSAGDPPAREEEQVEETCTDGGRSGAVSANNPPAARQAGNSARTRTPAVETTGAYNFDGDGKTPEFV